jgi:uncharacterized membrane protein YhhN
MKSKVIRIVFFVNALIHVGAQLLPSGELIQLITKPLIVPLLIAYYFSSTKYRSSIAVVALFACWAGDVALMFVPVDPVWFMVGLGSFLVGHICYILTYRQFRYDATEFELMPVQKIRFSLPIVLAGTGLIVVLYPVLGGLRFPVMIYALTIIIMVMNGLFRYGRTNSASFWLVFGGAILFMISDATLAINKFLMPVSLAGFWIMLTYIGAQWMIVEGLVEHQKDIKSQN